MKAKGDDDEDSDSLDEDEFAGAADMSDDSDEETAIERRARLQDAKIRKMKEQAAQELKTNIAEGEQFTLEDEEELQDLQDVNRRIQEIVGVLNNFKSSREEGVSRKDYLEKVSFISSIVPGVIRV